MVATLEARVNAFLSKKKIVLIGVSKKDKDAPANYNFKKLRYAGYDVYPVHPEGGYFHEEVCYKNLSELPHDLYAALVFTPPQASSDVVKACYEHGIRDIWIHRSVDQGSCSQEASAYMQDKPDVNFIDGACPMMFIKPVDFPHKCIKLLMKWTGKLPG